MATPALYHVKATGGTAAAVAGEFIVCCRRRRRRRPLRVMGALPRRSLAAPPRRPLAYKDKRKSKGDDAHSYDDADMTRPQLLNDNIHELMIPTPPYAAESAPDGRNSGQVKDKTKAKREQHRHKDAQ